MRFCSSISFMDRGPGSIKGPPRNQRKVAKRIEPTNKTGSPTSIAWIIG